MGTHTLLSPSSAHRWMLCAASVAACMKVKDERDNKDAALGTAKHAVSEAWLRTGVEPQIGQSVEADGFKFKIDAEFIDHVRTYVEAVRREPGTKYYEVELDTSEMLNVPGQGGTSDTVALDAERATLTVMDAKFGFHRVNAQDNPQGLIYIAAARRRFDLLCDWQKFRFVIVQPRIGHYDEATYTLEQLIEFEKRAQAAAHKAALITQYRPELIAENMTPSPEACEWCPIRGSCPARAKKIAAMFDDAPGAPDPLSLDNASLAKYLPMIDDIKGWCKDIEQEAHNRAMAGQTVPGWALEQGRRGNRYWKDPAAAEAALSLLGDARYEPRALKGPAPIEAELKARKIDPKATLKDLCGQPDGTPSLVPAAQCKKPYVAKRAEFDAPMSSLV